MSLVSVIVTNYNNNESLPFALASVVSQSHKNIECIVVDDGSTDSPKEIIERFNDSRLQLIQHTENKGRGAARQTALQSCSGDFITFVDSDDWIVVDKIEKQLASINSHPSCIYVTSSMYIVKTNNLLLGVRRVLKNLNTKDVKAFPAIKNAKPLDVPFAPCLIKAEIAKNIGFDERLNIAEDFDFMLRLSKCGSHIKMNEPLYVYAEVSSLNKNKLLESYAATRTVLFKNMSSSPLSAYGHIFISHLKSLFVALFGTNAVIGKLIGARTQSALNAEKTKFNRSLAHIQSILK